MVERERYQPTADQFALGEAMSDALEELLPIARLHERFHESDETWAALSELGVFGMTRAEEHGGSGLGPVEEALVAFELGRRLASPAVLATMAVAGCAGHGDGEVVAVGWPDGLCSVMINEPDATRVLMRGAAGWRLIERPATIAVLDETHWATDLLEVTGPTDGGARIDDGARTRVRLLDAAALAGLAAAALEMAVAYAGFREQFGRPIGSFQAVKHHCADMALAARGARDLVTFAAVALADGADDADCLTNSALVVAGTAAVRNAALNVQIHGGVGFSDEADPHLLVKRARIYLSAAGGLDAAVERLGVPAVSNVAEASA